CIRPGYKRLVTATW
nr:immunoglobulin heavy chain junction region [Macaca mulatta]